MTHTAAVLVLSCLAAVACGKEPGAPQSRRGEFHSSEPIVGRVVDAQTRQPIEGAVVLALWREDSRTIGGGYGVFWFDEAVSDAAGRFTISRWGPRYVQPDRALDARDPELWVIRRGYLLSYFDNEGASDPRFFRADQSLPIAKTPLHELDRPRERFYRRPAEPSVWNGRDLPLYAAPSAAETRRSLESATPVHRAFPVARRLERFCAEWRASASHAPEGDRHLLDHHPCAANSRDGQTTE